MFLTNSCLVSAFSAVWFCPHGVIMCTMGSERSAALARARSERRQQQQTQQRPRLIQPLQYNLCAQGFWKKSYNTRAGERWIGGERWLARSWKFLRFIAKLWKQLLRNQLNCKQNIFIILYPFQFPKCYLILRCVHSLVMYAEPKNASKNAKELDTSTPRGLQNKVFIDLSVI